MRQKLSLHITCTLYIQRRFSHQKGKDWCQEKHHCKQNFIALISKSDFSGGLNEKVISLSNIYKWFVYHFFDDNSLSRIRLRAGTPGQCGNFFIRNSPQKFRVSDTGGQTTKKKEKRWKNTLPLGKIGIKKWEREKSGREIKVPVK